VTVREVQWPVDIEAVARSLSRSDHWFWLDGSAPEPDGSSGFSYLGTTTTVAVAQRGEEREFLQLLRTGHRPEQESRVSGWVAAFAYEFGVTLLGEAAADDDAPPAFALRSETVLVLDHRNRRATLHAQTRDELEEWWQLHGPAFRASAPAALMNGPLASRNPAAGLRGAPGSGQTGIEANWTLDDTEYLARIGACKQEIREGEVYVVCLTDTARHATRTHDPLELYLRLRAGGAPTRGAVIATAGRALVSSSPERFLSKRGRSLATHPIKGTRPRGNTVDADRSLAADLAADPKERAENLMIVDLMRNDLARVCEPGTVRTEGFLRVESHPRVHQLVSTVVGRMKLGLDISDALEACFPGGSMTGAPKRRAVQLLSTLESSPRGLFSGCFGWIGDDGDAELAMTIRSIELRFAPPRAGTGGASTHEPLAIIGAGGGITSDSDPAAELREKHLKAAPLVAALTSR